MKKYFWISLILLLALVLRFYNNLGISLWHDEAFSALLIKYNWGEMMYRIGLDVHPPAYYVFLRIWHYVFGDSLLALRGMTVFFGVGTVWAVWMFVRTAFKQENWALWVALLVALNPFQVQYATEARMYTMGAFFAVLSAYFLTKALHSQKAFFEKLSLNMPHLPESLSLKRSMYLNYLGFTLSSIILIYTHYYLLFTVAAICFYGVVFLFFHHEGKFLQKFKWLFLSFIVIALAYVPWLKTFMFQYKQVGAGYWIPPMDKWSVPSTLWTLLVGVGHDVNNPTTQKMLVVFFLFCLFFLYKFLRKTQSFEKWLVLLATLAPFAGAVLFYVLAKLKGSNSSVYLVRYFIYTAAFLSVALVLWIKQISSKWLSRILIGVYCLVSFFALVNFWNELDVKTKPGMSAASKYLKANMQPQHKLYVGSSFMFFNLKYYAGQENFTNTPLLFSGGNRDTKNMPHFAGTAILTNEDLLPDFNETVKNSDTVWLVWTNGFGGQKPETPNNWTLVDEKAYAEIRPYIGTYVYVSQYKVN
jgi:uncharacterized membrane protein